MATPILDIVEIADGQVDQYAVANTAFRDLEKSTNDYLTVDMSSGTVAPTDAEFREAFAFICSGQTADTELTIPNIKRCFAVINSDSTYEVDVTKGSTVIAVALSSNGLFYSDDNANGLWQIA